MLSYQHSFHAGNHADILKHYVLFFVLKSLCKKEKPFTIIDTHGGSGLYDLLDNRACKTGEARKGIQKIFEKFSLEDLEKEDLPLSVKEYFSFIYDYVKKNLYPGSPVIEKRLLRSQDFLNVCELHPVEYENLSNNLKGQNVKIHNKNGFEVLNALTPPLTKRGAVLIDPSYEESKDYENVSFYVNQVLKKWSNGIFMIWYPLLSHRKEEIQEMIDSIINNARNINQNMEIAKLELKVFSEDLHKEVSLEEFDKTENAPRLYGSGMLILNMPWKLDVEGETAVKFLEKTISCF